MSEIPDEILEMNFREIELRIVAQMILKPNVEPCNFNPTGRKPHPPEIQRF